MTAQMEQSQQVVQDVEDDTMVDECSVRSTLCTPRELFFAHSTVGIENKIGVP